MIDPETRELIRAAGRADAEEAPDPSPRMIEKLRRLMAVVPPVSDSRGDGANDPAA